MIRPPGHSLRGRSGTRTAQLFDSRRVALFVDSLDEMPEGWVMR